MGKFGYYKNHEQEMMLIKNAISTNMCF